MADIIIRDVLCFIYSHFGSTPLAAILSVASSFFNDDKIIKTKQLVYDISSKSLDKEFVPRLIQGKGDNKRKQTEMILAVFFTLLDNHKVLLPNFFAHNLKCILPIEPGTADLCFLLE